MKTKTAAEEPGNGRKGWGRRSISPSGKALLASTESRRASGSHATLFFHQKTGTPTPNAQCIAYIQKINRPIHRVRYTFASITLPNANWFSKFFHRQSYSSKHLVKQISHHAANASLHYRVEYLCSKIAMTYYRAEWSELPSSMQASAIQNSCSKIFIQWRYHHCVH